MFGTEINFLAVFVVSILSFVIGFLWYGYLFGKQWLKLSKIPASEIAKTKQKNMLKPMILNFVGNLVMVYVFANFVNLFGISSASQGMILGFWIWLGFFASTTLLGNVLWENKPWGLFVLNGLYWLIELMIAGAILAIW